MNTAKGKNNKSKIKPPEPIIPPVYVRHIKWSSHIPPSQTGGGWLFRENRNQIWQTASQDEVSEMTNMFLVCWDDE